MSQLKIASGLLNDDRFPTTMSMHGVWIFLEGLRARVADLPETAKLEGPSYANMVGQTLETEARHLLHTVQLIASVSGPDYVSDLIAELQNFPDTVPVFAATVEDTEQHIASLRARLDQRSVNGIVIDD